MYYDKTNKCTTARQGERRMKSVITLKSEDDDTDDDGNDDLYL